jgi:electron transfer flavoprotein beta subunit
MPMALAEMLALPQLTFAKALECNDGTVRIERQTSEGYQVIECPLPALVTVTAGVNEPRYPSFKGIMAAKKKPLEQLSLSDLGLDGSLKVDQQVVGVEPAAARKAGEVMADDGSGASRIADFLRDAKVI